MVGFDYIRPNGRENSKKQRKIHQNSDFQRVVVRKSRQALPRILITFAYAKYSNNAVELNYKKMWSILI